MRGGRRRVRDLERPGGGRRALLPHAAEAAAAGAAPATRETGRQWTAGENCQTKFQTETGLGALVVAKASVYAISPPSSRLQMQVAGP